MTEGCWRLILSRAWVKSRISAYRALSLKQAHLIVQWRISIIFCLIVARARLISGILVNWWSSICLCERFPWNCFMYYCCIWIIVSRAWHAVVISSNVFHSNRVFRLIRRCSIVISSRTRWLQTLLRHRFQPLGILINSVFRRPLSHKHFSRIIIARSRIEVSCSIIELCMNQNLGTFCSNPCWRFIISRSRDNFLFFRNYLNPLSLTDSISCRRRFNLLCVRLVLPWSWIAIGNFLSRLCKYALL